MRSNRFLTAVLFVCLLIVGFVARAEEGRPLAPADRGLFFRAEGSANVFPAPVLGTAVEMRVTGIVARAKVTQIFTNPGKVWLEGIYVFPLPDGAAVDTLRMVVGERVLEGVIQEKNAARQTYEVAKQQGVKASLVEQQRPDVFTTSVANIGPGETVEITIEMQQAVRWDQGKFRLRFPMVVAPRYTPPGAKTEDSIVEAPVLPAGASNPFSFHVDLSPGFPLAKIASSSHDIAVETGAKEWYAIDLAKGVAPADSDFLLEWAPAVGREPRAVFYSEEVDGEHYGLLMVMPPDAPEAVGARIPREAIFVIDTSGSMDGESMEQARKALLLALDRLQPDDWFNVVEFDDDANALFSSSVPAQPQFVEKARAYVRGLAADGGTNILAGMEFAFVKSRRYDWLVPQTIFITDGQVGNEAEVYKFIDANLGTRRLFTVAIGAAPNVSFLRKAAELGRGTFTHILTVETVAERMGALFAQLEAPMLRDLEVRWDDPSAETWPARIPDLYLGEPLIVTVRQGEAGGVAVSGSRDSGPWEDSFPAPARVRGAGLDKLWAQRKIEGLLDGLDLGTAPDRDETRREVTALGLRHHLVTRFTSLVAVDVEKTAPAGVELVRGVVPVNRPRGDWPSGGGGGGGGGGEEVLDCITVTAESPLIDERRIAASSTVSLYDLDSIPTARDPWAVLQSVPGVLTDRVNVGGNESGTVVGQGAPGDQPVWSLDGMIVTDLSAVGSSPVYYNFNAFEEIQVTTGGADASLETPGAQVNLVTKRGTNEWRGSALGFTTTGEEDGEQNRLEELRQGEIEGGGPIRQDRLWVWGALHGSDTGRMALGGQTEDVRLGSEILKGNVQISNHNAAALFWSRGDSSGSGLGASPARARETTWERDGREETWKIEDTQVVGYSFYATLTLSGSDRSLRDLPSGGPGGDLRIGPDGAASGTWFGLGEDSEMRAADLRSSSFFETGNLSHELRSGLSWRDQEDRRSLTVPGRVDVAGGIFGLEGPGVVESWRGGEVSAETGTRSAWIEDLLERDRLKFVLGLRYDEEDLGISGLRPQTLSPRLGLTWTLGEERQGLLRASLARFASRLGTDPAFRLQPFATTYFQRQPGGELSPWYTAGTGNAIDSGLAPEITDELVLGGEYAPFPDLLLGLQATWRRTTDVLEERLLVRDASGRVFAATAFDWMPAGRLTGVLPDGSPYDVPVYDLRPGLSLAGGTRLVNGDRERDFRSLSLTWQKRFQGSWSSRGHLTWSDGTWSLGPEFTRYDDPTRTLGAGDRDGEAVALPASDRDRPYASDRFVGARWSLHWEGLVRLPWELTAGFAVNGREGYPLAWYRQVARERAGIARVQLADAIDAGRADDLWTLDVRLEREIYLGDFVLTPGVDVFNLLDEDVALWRETDLGVTRAGAVDEAVAARTVRLGVRVSWR